MRGKFVTFEGIDGVGKSTQVKLLKQSLDKLNIPAIITREPGGTEGAEEIRHLLKKSQLFQWDNISELLLISAARRDHVIKKIKPALEGGTWVICDRFSDSTIAYQGYLLNIDSKIIEFLCELSTHHLKPDLTFILDVDAEISYNRLRQRQGTKIHEDKYDHIQLGQRLKLASAFKEIASNDVQRYHIIDALPDAERIHEDILQILDMTY